MGMVDYSVAGRVANIQLRRPEKLNALNNELLADYVQALIRFDRDDTADVGIVSGAGRAFTTGSDINQRLLAIADDGMDTRTLPNESDPILHAENWKPLIAAVHGYALGHGFVTAMLCDIVVAAEGTQFQITDTAYGVPTSGFWTHLAHSAGAAFASDVVLTGRFFSAREAHAASLISRVVPDGSHITEATATAEQIARNPQAALRETVRYRRGELAEVMQRASWISGGFKWSESDDFKNAIRAKTP